VTNADGVSAPTQVLFDFDGTLVNSEPGIVASWRHTFATLGMAERSEAEIRHLIGPPLLELVNDLTDDPELRQAIVATYIDHYDTIGLRHAHVYPGVEELLGELRRDGRTLAVATSKSEHIAVEMLAELELSSYFSVVAGALRDGSRHYKHDVIAHAITQLPQASRVMVGDRLHDVHGARQFDIDCIGVLWGYGDRAELSGAGAVALVADTTELARALGLS
jgi:phosphoglycolate phosphatase